MQIANNWNAVKLISTVIYIWNSSFQHKQKLGQGLFVTLETCKKVRL